MKLELCLPTERYRLGAPPCNDDFLEDVESQANGFIMLHPTPTDQLITQSTGEIRWLGSSSGAGVGTMAAGRWL